VFQIFSWLEKKETSTVNLSYHISLAHTRPAPTESREIGKQAVVRSARARSSGVSSSAVAAVVDGAGNARVIADGVRRGRKATR
jgi:hypothetical protein